MDCDDFMLALARVEAGDPNTSPSEILDLHSAECPTCSELAQDLLGGAEPDELLGQEIGPYKIQALLGAGGMGRVYLATHPGIMSRVAIKVFSRDWNANPDLVARFFAEARSTNVIGHENIVNVLDVGRLDDGRPYMVMEHLPGQPLSELIRSERLTDALVVRLMMDVLSALAAAHDHSIIHRDLKPDNIYVSPEGRATLLDFGIAKLLPSVGDISPATATGLILGTPHYMSPEQARGNDIDLRTDVYAIGVILYECVTGQRPFEGSSLYSLLDQHVNVAPRSPKRLRPDLNEEMEGIILQALSKRPEDRYQTATQMREALATIPAGDSAGAFLVSPSMLESTIESELAETAETVAGHRLKSSSQLPQAQPVPRPWKQLSALALVFVGGLILWQIMGGPPRTSPKGPTNHLEVPPSLEVAVSPSVPMITAVTVLDVDLADAMVMDAAMAIDAQLSPATKLRPTKTAKRRSQLVGVAPLSFLEEATLAAEKDMSDAVLLGIDLEGLDSNGRVDTSIFRNHIYFDFVSPLLVDRAGDRRFSSCVIRVQVGKEKNPVVDRKHTEWCNKLRPVKAPRCSMASLLDQARKERSIPPTFTPTRATLRTSTGRSPKPFWKVSIAGANYELPNCN